MTSLSQRSTNNTLFRRIRQKSWVDRKANSWKPDKRKERGGWGTWPRRRNSLEKITRKRFFKFFFHLRTICHNVQTDVLRLKQSATLIHVNSREKEASSLKPRFSEKKSFWLSPWLLWLSACGLKASYDGPRTVAKPLLDLGSLQHAVGIPSTHPEHVHPAEKSSKIAPTTTGPGRFSIRVWPFAFCLVY